MYVHKILTSWEHKFLKTEIFLKVQVYIYFPFHSRKREIQIKVTNNFDLFSSLIISYALQFQETCYDIFWKTTAQFNEIVFCVLTFQEKHK